MVSCRVPHRQLSTVHKPKLSMASPSEMSADLNIYKVKKACMSFSFFCSCSGKKEYEFLEAAVWHIPYNSYAPQSCVHVNSELCLACHICVSLGDQFKASVKYRQDRVCCFSSEACHCSELFRMSLYNCVWAILMSRRDFVLFTWWKQYFCSIRM